MFLGGVHFVAGNDFASVAGFIGPKKARQQ